MGTFKNIPIESPRVMRICQTLIWKWTLAHAREHSACVDLKVDWPQSQILLNAPYFYVTYF